MQNRTTESNADKLIRLFLLSQEEETYDTELDNGDLARLKRDRKYTVVVVNEHGSEFPVYALSETEIETFLDNLT